MKNILVGIALIMSINGISQTKPKQDYSVSRDTITKAKMREVKLLSDLITDISPTFTTILYEITFKKGGLIRVISGNGMELKPSQTKELSQVSRNSKMFIDLKVHENNKSISKSYAFYIIE